MYKQVAEYVGSLSILGGKHWLKDASISFLLTGRDVHVVNTVLMGQINNDKDLVQHLYGSSAKVDARYRRRMGRLANRLAQMVLDCTLASSLDDRRRDTIKSVRHMCTGETLLRTAAPTAARHHLLEALRSMIQPELAWYVPGVHFALAYYDAVNRRSLNARQSVARARQACDRAMIVSTFQELWLLLTIPTPRKVDKTRASIVIDRARLLLAQTARKPITGVIGTMAARLASSVSQHTGNIVLGLRWLERWRDAMRREGNYHDVAAREYHAQRLFLFNVAQDYVNGVAEANQIAELTPANSTSWFTAMNTLLHIQLKSGDHATAKTTAVRLLSEKSLSKQPSQLISRIQLRALYAQILTKDKNVTMRSINTVKRYVLDALVLRILWALQQKRDTQASRAMLSLTRYVDRMQRPRSDRALWLLSKLLPVYALHKHVLRECRKVPAFRKYEAELKTLATMDNNNTVLSPQNIWKSISGYAKKR